MRTGCYRVIIIQHISIGRQAVKRGRILFVTWKRMERRMTKRKIL
jgi:hypothetical protein